MSAVRESPYISGYEMWKEHYQSQSDTVNQFTNFTLSTTLLLSEIFQKIPKVVPRTARTLLTYTGILTLHYQTKELNKNCRDLKLAWEAKELSAIALTGAKVAVKASDIFLTIGSFAFACVSLAGNPALTLSYYTFVRPLATGAWGMLIAFDVIDHKLISSLLEKLKKIDSSEDQEQISTYFKWILHNETKQPSLIKQDNQKIARDLAQQYDLYRLAEIEKALKEDPTQDFFALLIANMEKRQTIKTADLALKIFGYISLGINSAYPETLIQASTYWSMSALFTTLHIYNKFYKSPLPEPQLASNL